MKNSKKLKFTFETFEEILSLATMIVMFLAIGVNIVMNWFARVRLGKLEELGTAAYMFCCYAAFAWMYQHKDLTEVNFVVNAMGPKLRWFADLFRYLFLVAFGVMLTYYGVKLCQNSVIKKLPALQIPYIYLDVSIVFGFGVLTIRALRDFLYHFTTAKSAFSSKEAGGNVS